MIKILYISYDGLTDPLGQSQIIPYLIGLSKKGYKFHIISCEKKEKYLEEKKKIANILSENNINWHPVFYTKSPPILSTVWDIHIIKSKAIELQKKEFFSIIHCRSYISSLIGLWMKKHYSVKFIFDMRGFWADERVEGKLWNLKNPMYRLVYAYFKNKEKDFLSNADYVVSLTEAGKSEIHSWRIISNQPIPIEVIPCCVDTELFNPDLIKKQKQDEYRKLLFINNDDFILCYIGAIGTWYLLDNMLAFFKQLLIHNHKAKFLFITHENPNTIFKKSKSMMIPIDRIIVHKAERDNIPTLLSLSNASVFFIKPSFSKIASSPTKQAEILSMGIPIICNSGIGDNNTIYKAGMCITLQEFNESEYENAIPQLINSLSEKFSQNLRQFAIHNFSLEKGINSYDYIYKAILKI